MFVFLAIGSIFSKGDAGLAFARSKGASRTSKERQAATPIWRNPLFIPVRIFMLHLPVSGRKG